MVEVYVWDYKSIKISVGHASMKVKDYYISWWPTETGRIQQRIEIDFSAGKTEKEMEDSKLPTGVYGMEIHEYVFETHPLVNRTYEEDVFGEGRKPDHTIKLKGLDELKIINWWKSTSIWADPNMHGPPSHPWETLGWNCSKIVASALDAGGGAKFASWGKTWNMVWIPDDVRKYADSIKKGLAKES